jgi:small-conductance mechanosensitive channel
MAARVKKVRKKVRPSRSTFLLLLAIAAAVIAFTWAHKASPNAADRAIRYGCSAAIVLLGMSAAFGLAGKTRDRMEPVIGQAHAGVLRYAIVLTSLFVLLVLALDAAGVGPGQLVLGGAITGVLLGIAAQQSLANLFAGLVLLFARPFRVGDQARFRSGSLSGQVEGIVVDISLTYVRLATEDGPVLIPNAQALAAAVLLVRPPAPAIPPDSGDGQVTASAPGNAPDPPQPYPGGGPPDPPQQSGGMLGATAGDQPDARSQPRPSSATSASDWPHTSQ